MARYRLSEPAKADIAAILRRSEAVHGKQSRIRYRACLTAAMRRVAADPVGISTVDVELVPGVRSFYIRHSRDESREVPVANPVHVLFYRLTQQPGTVEIVRVLHDRMEPRLHISSED